MNRTARSLTAAAIAGSVLALAPTSSAHAVSMSCSLTGGVMTVTANDDQNLTVTAVENDFVALGVGGELCTAPVASISDVVVDMGDGPGTLALVIGEGRPYGPSADGRTMLPTTVVGTSPDLHVHVVGGDLGDVLESVPTPGLPLPWAVDVIYGNGLLEQGVPDVALGLGPTLHLDGAGGHDVVMPSPGRPEVLQDTGPSVDTDIVDFIHYVSGAYADLDGLADDGGEGDQVATTFEWLYGGPGDDVLVGDADRDVLRGNLGNDVLVGRAGDDDLEGGFGDDVVNGNDGTDLVVGDEGDDLLRGGDSADTILGEEDDDVLLGGAGVDRMLAGPGIDSADGGAGDDELFGGDGSDSFFAGSADDGSDLVDGGAGVDTMSYAARSRAVTVRLDGQADDGFGDEYDDVEVDNVVGGAGADILVGNAAANRLTGGGGGDTITGGSGADVLSGGSGGDRFYANDGAKDTVDGGSGTDKARVDGVDVRRSIESTF